MRRSVLVTLFVFVSGCAVYDDRIAGTFRPSPANGFKGVIHVELGGGIERARPFMMRNCAPYGGLRESSVKVTSADSFQGRLNALTGTDWAYECNGPQPLPVTQPARPGPPPAISTPVAPPVRVSVQQASERCLDLGFKKGTDELLGCIERLRRQ